jgi:hypothetical protein
VHVFGVTIKVLVSLSVCAIKRIVPTSRGWGWVGGVTGISVLQEQIVSLTFYHVQKDMANSVVGLHKANYRVTI